MKPEPSLRAILPSFPAMTTSIICELIATLAGILGSYHKTAPIETFTLRPIKTDSHASPTFRSASGNGRFGSEADIQSENITIQPDGKFAPVLRLESGLAQKPGFHLQEGLTGHGIRASVVTYSAHDKCAGPSCNDGAVEWRSAHADNLVRR